MADGCSTNIAAGNQLTKYLGFLTPNLRRVLHAADGSIKCMINSKTMNFQELSDFIPAIRAILRHFQPSGNSTFLLNEALEMMEIKSVHMVSCPTRMSYLLSAASEIVRLLVPLCDVLATANMEEEHRDLFMLPTGMILIHLLADLKDIFFKSQHTKRHWILQKK